MKAFCVGRARMRFSALRASSVLCSEGCDMPSRFVSRCREGSPRFGPSLFDWTTRRR